MTQQQYFSLCEGRAKKIAVSSVDCITYRILKDQDNQLYIRMTGHDKAGTYFKYPIPFSCIEQCVEDIPLQKDIYSTVFKKAFNDGNRNNSGFLVAILRAENLLVPCKNGVIVSDPDIRVIPSRIQPNWPEWKARMLSKLANAVPFA